MGPILFPLGIRLSTWLALLVFVSLAAWRSERAPLVAAVAWLAGFETAYQIAAFLLTPPPHLTIIGPVSLSLVVGMPMAAAAMTALGGRPNLPVLALAILIFAVWVAAGFHVNTSAVGLDPAAEAFNEGAKTLWALAYLIPLVVVDRSGLLVSADNVEANGCASAASVSRASVR